MCAHTSESWAVAGLPGGAGIAGLLTPDGVSGDAIGEVGSGSALPNCRRRVTGVLGPAARRRDVAADEAANDNALAVESPLAGAVVESVVESPCELASRPGAGSACRGGGGGGARSGPGVASLPLENDCRDAAWKFALFAAMSDISSSCSRAWSSEVSSCVAKERRRGRAGWGGGGGEDTSAGEHKHLSLRTTSGGLLFMGSCMPAVSVCVCT
jgi:hypothetical protein